jgi:hypothetical protein
VHEHAVTHVPGDPARPFDRAQVSAKFLRFVGPVLGTERAEYMLERCHEALATGAFTLLLTEIEQACRNAGH